MDNLNVDAVSDFSNVLKFVTIVNTRLV